MTTNRHFCEVFFTDVRVPAAQPGRRRGRARSSRRCAQLEHERGGIDRLVSNRALYEMALARADRSDPLVRQEIAALETGYRLGRILVIREVLAPGAGRVLARRRSASAPSTRSGRRVRVRVLGAEATLWERRHPRARLRARATRSWAAPRT